MDDLSHRGAGVAPHDLHTFLTRSANDLAAEYRRIRSRAIEDPGTAGDEGEENWREILANWLPSDLVVTTKGRILGADGTLSKQVDVVVLRPGYPKALINRKIYLAGGVLAAFECKLTLKPGHIAKAATNARIVRRLSAPRVGTPYSESHGSIIFGILAHSTTIRRDPLKRVDQLLQAELERDNHPSEELDVLCIADLACWRGWTTHLPAQAGATWESTRSLYRLPPEGGSMVMYMRADAEDRRPSSADVLWATIDCLTRRIAWELPQYQGISQYLTLAQGPLGRSSSVATRVWPFTYLSAEVRSKVASGHLTNRGWVWDPWGMIS
jgi:hypothetical protein